MSRIPRILPPVLTALIVGCGGGGGGGGDGGGGGGGGTAPEENPIALPMVDSVPGAGANSNPLDTTFNIAHLGHSDLAFEYGGACGPTGFALRHGLFDLSIEDVDQVIGHQLECPSLRPMESYTVSIEGVRQNGARFEASFDFATTIETPGLLTVQHGRITPANTVEDLFKNYVDGALFDELDLPGAVERLVTRIVLEVAEANWRHIVDPAALYDTVSQRVSYRSRAPDGSPSDRLTGLITFPDTFSVQSFHRRDRVIVLAHATGSTPSELDPADAWFILANQFAARGYLVVTPDNWGRGGTSENPETYLMASRTAYNALDLLNSALADDSYAMFHDPQSPTAITIIGYSQGGHSALALWLLAQTTANNLDVREVYAGGGPHSLYQTIRGVLQHLDGRCDGSAYCRFVGKDTILPYATERIIPALVAYTDIGLTESDLIIGDDLTGKFVSGFLDNDPAYDAMKILLQLNSLSNMTGLADAIEPPDTRVHLYHSRFDRLVPVENTGEMAAALMPDFNVDVHENLCNSDGYELIFNTTSKVGVLHTLCGLAVMNDAMKNLR